MRKHAGGAWDQGLTRAAERVRESVALAARPVIVAIDGRSGVGKSTFAAELARTLGVDVAVIEGDDFFAGGVTLRGDSVEERAAQCIDWRAQREVLMSLRAGREAVYHAFDWESFDGRVQDKATWVRSARVLILEGVYAARRELRDLVDVAILLRAPEEIRTARLLKREGSIRPWERQWHEAEVSYFASLGGDGAFDVVVEAM